MSQKFHVKVNNSKDLELTKQEVNSLDVIKTNQGIFHILLNNKTYLAEIVSSDFYSKKYTVKINNNQYTVDISSPLDQLIKKMGFELGTIKQIDSIKAPMPGLILDIMVKVGQEVKEDDGLLILEAMKMENIITSPIDGIIKSINIAKGDAIDKNHLLIEFE